jgi:hypothetical protein
MLHRNDKDEEKLRCAGCETIVQLSGVQNTGSEHAKDRIDAQDKPGHIADTDNVAGERG